MKRSLLRSLLILQICLLAACQSVPDEPALFEFDEVIPEDTVFVIDVFDPVEPLNRAMYKFNAVFDGLLFLPATQIYDFVTPTFVQDRVSNFFSNLTELNTFANSILQGKLTRASRALVRFVVNSTVGVAGLFDPMAALGTEQQREDLGQTLGTWGFGNGPYLVLPIFGPSNLRDTAGLVGDTVAYRAADPGGLATFESDHPEMTLLRAIDKRHSIAFRYFETGSPFEYDLVRLLYTKKRQLDIEK